MDKKTLYRFFDGVASSEEKKAVKVWLESSTENRDELFKEREFFDAVILSEDNSLITRQEIKKKSGTYRVILRELFKIAAVVAITIACGMYFFSEKNNEYEMAVNTLIVPAGQRANLILPDGTNVWLNARTEIKYPAIFSDDKREIELNGEAYFEVSHKEKQPFIVHTRFCDVEVMGTSFNVEAYEDTEFFSTALMEGAVKVSHKNDTSDVIILKPYQKANREGGSLVVSMIDDYDPYRWKEGLICFKNTNFMELMKKFEKCYGIDIIIENEKLSDHVFSGKFRISDGIDNALRVLQKEAKYTFTRNSDDSLIYIK